MSDADTDERRTAHRSETDDEADAEPLSSTRREAMGLLGFGGFGFGRGRSGRGGRGQPFYDWQDDVDANGNDLVDLGALSTVDTQTPIRDFAGENLSVDDGVLHADASSAVWADTTGDGLLETPDHEGIDVPAVRTKYVETTASEFTVAVLPDTQHYSRLDNGIFQQQTQWLVDNWDDLDGEMVLHLGDVVADPSDESEWDVAEEAIGILDDAGIPSLLCFGNHDAVDLREPTRFRERFPVERYERIVDETENVTGWGSYEGYSENVYLTQRVLGERFLYLTLEFGPRDAVLEWANDVVADHPDHTAVVVTHSYTAPDGTLVDEGTNYAPTNYFPDGADANNGVDVWEKFVSNHRNVQFAQSAHHLATNYADRVDSGEENNLVTQMFSNYQTEPNGGDGWLRLNRLDVDRGVASVDTYSPYLEEWASSGGETFDFDLWEYETDTVVRGQDDEDESDLDIEDQVRSIVRQELVDVVDPDAFLDLQFVGGSGSAVTDHSQFEFDGQLEGEYNRADDGVVEFFADAGGNLTVGSPRLLTGLEDVTFEAVVRPTGYPAQYGIVASKHNGGDDGEWYIAIDDSTFRFAHVSVSDGRRYLDQPYEFDTGELYHLAVTHDRTAETVTFYVNGEEIATASRPGTTKATQHPLVVGNYTPIGGNWQFGGDVYSFAIHPDPLDGEEIQARYRNSAAGDGEATVETTDVAAEDETNASANDTVEQTNNATNVDADTATSVGSDDATSVEPSNATVGESSSDD